MMPQDKINPEYEVTAGVREGSLKGNRKPLSPNQTRVYDLMLRSLQALRNEFCGLRLGLLFAIAGLALGAVIGGLLVTTVGWAINRVNGPQWVIYTAGLIPIVVTLALVLPRRFGFAKHIYLDSNATGEFIRFERLDNAIGFGWIWYSCLLGSLIGIQVQLMYLTPSHGGLPITGEWDQCTGIAVDNVSHGVLLDACELYDVRVGEKVTHSRSSATLFFVFRTTCDGILIILGISLWHRQKVVHLTRRLAEVLAAPTPDSLKAYLRKVCYKSKNWAKAYHDEFVFFCLVEKYLSGYYPQCRQLGSLFPEISIPPEVRALFTDEAGKCLIPVPTAEEQPT